MTFKRNLTLSLLLCMLGFALFQACDSPPGSSNFEFSPNLLKMLVLEPGDITFEPEAGAVDTTITFTLETHVSQPDLLESVKYTLKLDGSETTLRSGTLQPTSRNPEIFAAEFTITTNTSEFRAYRVHVFGETETGKLSNTLQRRITFTGFLTDPPEIVFLDHPDEVQIPDEGVQPFRFEAKVVHPNGQNNLEIVYLELYDSGGNQVGNRRYQMFDDGSSESGDLVAGDSVYTKSFQIGPQNNPDVYDIWCYAIDRQGVSSDTTFSTLSIVQ